MYPSISLGDNAAPSVRETGGLHVNSTWAGVKPTLFTARTSACAHQAHKLTAQAKAVRVMNDILDNCSVVVAFFARLVKSNDHATKPLEFFIMSLAV
jgi:tRNA C32,U32 (ribose-2'-O)-methylase TrmJ